MIRARHTVFSAILVAMLACASGCSVKYIVPEKTTGYPAKIVISGWTNTGCIENLHEYARDVGVHVQLVRVARDYEGAFFGIFPSPYYPMYVCYGEVIPPLD